MNPALTSELTPEIRRNGAELFVTQSLVRNLQIQQAYKEKFIPMMSKVWAAVEADFLIHPESVPMGELEFPRPDMYDNYKGGSDDILRGLGIIPQDAKSTYGSTAHVEEFQRILAEKGITRAVVGAEGIYSELKALFRSGIPERGAVVLVNKRGSDRLVVKPLAGNRDVLFIYNEQWKKCHIAANPEIFQKAQAAKPVVAEAVASQKSGGATAQVASKTDQNGGFWRNFTNNLRQESQAHANANNAVTTKPSTTPANAPTDESGGSISQGEDTKPAETEKKPTTAEDAEKLRGILRQIAYRKEPDGSCRIDHYGLDESFLLSALESVTVSPDGTITIKGPFITTVNKFVMKVGEEEIVISPDGRVTQTRVSKVLDPMADTTLQGWGVPREQLQLGERQIDSERIQIYIEQFTDLLEKIASRRRGSG